MLARHRHRVLSHLQSTAHRARTSAATLEALRAPTRAPAGQYDTGDDFNVELVQMVHRHGDRAPILNVMEGNSPLAAEERDFWQAKLPQEDLLHSLAAFPVSSANPKSMDAASNVFGCLTETGVHQMMRLGLQLRDVAEPYGLLPSLVHAGHIPVTASNFIRTQTSARALLFGLLAPDDARAMLAETEQGPPDGRATPLIAADPTTPAEGVEEDSRVPVNVAPAHAESINVYSSRPAMQRAIAAVSKSTAFSEREREHVHHREAIAAALPYLHAANSPFLWLHAADHFACRDAHHLPLLPGLSRDTANAASGQVDWRFQQWYSDPRIRAHASGPLLTDILRTMQHRALGRSDARIAVYSGHDVTLLPLLHAITGKPAHAWPAYASSLRLELARHRADPGQLFVRAYYNDAPLDIVGCSGNTCTLHHFNLIAVNERSGRPSIC